MNKAPAAHVIPGAGIVVDGFRLASSISTKTFFLSHFHADHYDGLTNEWSAGTIYCSVITARLVVTVIGVDASYVKPLPMDQEINVEGVEVTLLDANHCPGASLLLFRLQDGTLYLHTGDMRYHPRMQEYPALQSARGKIDTVFLDTTYSQPKYNFVEQLNAMDHVADAIAELLQEEKDGKSQTKTLFLLSAYKLGKERMMLHVAKRTGLPICVDENKLKVIQCLTLDEEDMRCFTLDPAATPLHVCRMGFCGEMWPFFRPNFVNMKAHYDEYGAPHGYTHICGYIPTGWSIGSNYNKRNSRVEKDNMAVTLAPYSEHSNFEGLTEFVKFLRPRCVYATVFKDEKDKKKIEKRFSTLLDSAANKRAFLSLFARPSSSSSSSTAALDSSSLLQQQAELELQQGDFETGDELAAMPRCPSTDSNKSDPELLESDVSVVEDVKREISVCDEGDDGGFVCAAEDAKIRDADSDDNVVIEVTPPCVSPKPAAVDVDRVVSSSWACRVCTYIHAAHERAARVCAMCGASRPDCGQVALSPKTATPNEKPQSSDRGSSKRVQAITVEAGSKKQRTLFAYMSKNRT